MIVYFSNVAYFFPLISSKCSSVASKCSPSLGYFFTNKFGQVYLIFTPYDVPFHQKESCNGRGADILYVTPQLVATFWVQCVRGSRDCVIGEGDLGAQWSSNGIGTVRARWENTGQLRNANQEARERYYFMLLLCCWMNFDTARHVTCCVSCRNRRLQESGPRSWRTKSDDDS